MERKEKKKRLWNNCLNYDRKMIKDLSGFCVHVFVWRSKTHKSGLFFGTSLGVTRY